MRFTEAMVGLALGAVVAAGSTATAREQATGSPVQAVAGSYTYRTYCASCHGARGKGDGPLAESLRFHPPDLTQLAKDNDGTYPAETVRQIIDGRKPVAGHGGPDMPVWGDAFKNADTGYDEKAVERKIQSLVDYLKTLQE
jgi:mono/diheme cytochrome c family protein